MNFCERFYNSFIDSSRCFHLMRCSQSCRWTCLVSFWSDLDLLEPRLEDLLRDLDMSRSETDIIITFSIFTRVLQSMFMNFQQERTLSSHFSEYCVYIKVYRCHNWRTLSIFTPQSIFHHRSTEVVVTSGQWSGPGWRLASPHQGSPPVGTIVTCRLWPPK